MLRLGMLLVGTALLIRYRRRKGVGQDGDDLSSDDSSNFAPPGGMPRPTLDSALRSIPQQSWGDLFQNVIPAPDFGRPPTGTIINPVPQIGTGANGQPPTAGQLSSANNMLNAIIG